MDRLQRRHTGLHIDRKFTRVQAVRIDGGIGAERHRHTQLDCLGNIFSCDRQHFPGLGKDRRRHAELLCVIDEPTRQIQRRHQPGAALLHHFHNLGIDVGTVLDGIHARRHRKLDAVRPVRMRGHLAAKSVRFGDHCFHFLKRVL